MLPMWQRKTTLRQCGTYPLSNPKRVYPPPIGQLFSILLPIAGSLKNWSDQWLLPRFATISMESDSLYLKGDVGNLFNRSLIFSILIFQSYILFWKCWLRDSTILGGLMCSEYAAYLLARSFQLYWSLFPPMHYMKCFWSFNLF